MSCSDLYKKHGKLCPVYILYLGCLISAFAIKLFYTNADSSSLQFILAPVTRLVEVFTGTLYHFVPERGYMSSDLTVEIGPSCAGINFLVILFCSFSFSFIKEFSGIIKVLAAVLFLILSYIITVIVNTFRIVAAINFTVYNDAYLKIDKEDFHKILGTLVYFFFLVLFYMAISRLVIFLKTRKSRGMP